MVWKPNNTYNITWNKTGSFSHVDISLVSDTGYTTTLAEKVSNTGSYNWTVPSDITISNSKVMVSLAEEKNYFDYINSNSISAYSNKRVSIYSLCSGLDEVIDDFGTEMLDTGREALKDITKIHLSEEEEDEEIDPNPDGPLRSSKDEDEDRKGDQEIDRDGLISRLKELRWQITEDPEGPTEYYNEETGETIIVNEDSDYDMEIAYKPDGEEVTVEMLMQEKPDGGADIYTYYNVWLRSKEDPDHLIHEEKMRMKYEYIVEELEHEIGEKPHNLRFGMWQRTSVEMSFNHNPDYEAGEKNTDDKVVWDYYEIGNNNAKTIWDFYFGKILSSFPFQTDSISGYDFSESTPILETKNGITDAYYEYENEYDFRLKLKVYSNFSRERANEIYGDNTVDVTNLLTVKYLQLKIDNNGNSYNDVFTSYSADLNDNVNGNMILHLIDNLVLGEVDINLKLYDYNDNLINFGDPLTPDDVENENVMNYWISNVGWIIDSYRDLYEQGIWNNQETANNVGIHFMESTYDMDIIPDLDIMITEWEWGNNSITKIEVINDDGDYENFEQWRLDLDGDGFYEWEVSFNDQNGNGVVDGDDLYTVSIIIQEDEDTRVVYRTYFWDSTNECYYYRGQDGKIYYIPKPLYTCKWHKKPPVK